MKLYELAVASCVFDLVDYKNSYDDFLNKINNSLDMRNRDHVEALLVWLNKWGCRQFEKDKKRRHKDLINLMSWYKTNENLLPPPNRSLLELSDEDMVKTKTLYETLSELKLANGKTAGPTGASKILFALRKEIFPPWDDAMRKGKYKENGDNYVEFMLATQDNMIEIKNECIKHGFDLKQLPEKLHKEKYSIVKLLDEHNWVVITREFNIPKFDTIKHWYNWAK